MHEESKSFVEWLQNSWLVVSALSGLFLVMIRVARFLTVQNRQQEVLEAQARQLGKMMSGAQVESLIEQKIGPIEATLKSVHDDQKIIKRHLLGDKPKGVDISRFE